MSEWLPIETAPKDGTRVLLFDPDISITPEHAGILTGKWNTHYSQWEQEPCEASEWDPDNRKPTHWMPLPPPPTDTRAEPSS